MAALLDLPEVRAQILRISVEDYHRQTGGQQTELLRGIVLQKMSKSPLHCSIAARLHRLLAPQISPGFVLFHERPITLADSEPEPDLCIVPGTEEEFELAHPSMAEMVVEVAVSSLELDRIKALIYAEAGVKEYWIVCPKERRVEVYRRPTPQGYAEQTQLAPPAVLECGAVPGVRVDLAQLLR